VNLLLGLWLLISPWVLGFTGNAGTAVFGRMDMEELATPGYATLSAATRIKLATLPKGELMLRHPHFTQPIFVRFPKPPVLRGRDGVERFPPAAEVSFEEAVVRQLVRLDRRVRPNQVKDLIADGELVAPFKSQADPARAYFAIVAKNAAGRPEVAAFVEWLKTEAAKR